MEAEGKLLARLRKGHKWLAEIHLKLLEGRQTYKGMEERFLENIDFWDRMDRMLRGVYGFEACVMGPGQRCPDESPVTCRGCTSSRKLSNKS